MRGEGEGDGRDNNAELFLYLTIHRFAYLPKSKESDRNKSSKNTTEKNGPSPISICKFPPLREGARER